LISDLAILIANGRLVEVTPDLFLPSPNFTSHRSTPFANLTFAFPHALRASRCQYGVEWLREKLDRRRLRFVPIDGVDQAGRGQESASRYAIESRTNIQIGWIMPASQIRERLRRLTDPARLAAQLAQIAVARMEAAATRS
jgi:hypothetical protein